MKNHILDGLQVIVAIVITGSTAYAMKPPELVEPVKQEVQVVSKVEVKPKKKPVIKPQEKPSKPIKKVKKVMNRVVVKKPVRRPVVRHRAVVSKDCFGTTGAKRFMYSHESTCRLHAVNGIGCKGLGQDCNGSLPKACPNWRTDFACQDRFWESYMKRRYGSWEKAKAFWQARVPINGKDVGNWW